METTGKLIAIAGPIIALASLSYSFYKRKKLLKEGYGAEAEIVEAGSADGEEMPVVRFRTVTGELIKGKLDYNSTKLKPGDKVNILYDPKKPHRFRSESWPKVYKALGLGMVITSIVFLIILYYFLFYKK